MKPEEMGFIEKAALLISNIAFFATIGFGAYFLMTHG